MTSVMQSRRENTVFLMRPSSFWGKREGIGRALGAAALRPLTLALALALSATPLACGGDSGGTSDGAVDSALPDGSAPDGSVPDGSLPDGGVDAALDAPADAPLDALPDSTVPPGRAFRGAAPNIPHDLFGCGITCLTCHETGVGGAPMTTHPERQMCTQCHMAADTTIAPFVGNTFVP